MLSDELEKLDKIISEALRMLRDSDNKSPNLLAISSSYVALSNHRIIVGICCSRSEDQQSKR